MSLISAGPIIEQGTHFCDLARYSGGEVDITSVSAHSLDWDENAGQLSVTRKIFMVVAALEPHSSSGMPLITPRNSSSSISVKYGWLEGSMVEVFEE
jgi:predicted dehydrogenase